MVRPYPRYGRSRADADRPARWAQRSGLGLLLLGGLDLDGLVDRLADGAVGTQVLQLDHVAGGVGHDGRLDDAGERLAAQDLLHQLGDVVVLEHVVRELLRVLTGLLGLADHVLGELLLVDAELLDLGDLVQDELGGDRVTDPALEVGLELLLGLALVLEVLVHGHAGVRELLLEAAAARVELVGDDRLGQRDVDGLQQRLQHRVAGGGGLLEAAAAAEPLPHVLGQLLDGVELGGQLGELVVELGELLLLDLADGDRDVDALADQVTTHELGGEDLLVAGGQADQRLVETVDHAAATDAVGHAGHLGALDDLAVLGRLEVHDHEVTVGGRALDVDQGREALTQRLDLLVDGLLEDDATADLAVDDGRRDLATAEAWDVDLRGDLLIGRVEARLELLEGHLDGQLGPGRAQGLDGALHRLSPTFR